MADKDYERAKRLNEVYKHLFMHYGIESQTAMADFLKVSRTGLSAAFNGNKQNLTNNLFKKICAAFPGIFNLDYLLTGRGELLSPIPLPQGQQVSDVKEVEYTHNLFDLAMQVIKDNEDLHRQLQASIAELRSLIDRYGPIIESERKTKKSPRQYPSMVAEDLDKSDGKN